MIITRFGQVFFLLLVTGFLLINPATSWSKTLPLEGFTELVETVSPAVVNIRTVKTFKGDGPFTRRFQRAPGEQGNPFEDFFNRFYDSPKQEYKQRSLGSGFIMDPSGYIVTNNHVIEKADEIEVKLKNGEEFKAKIIGRDPNTDLALIKIEPGRKLPSLPMGNSDTLKVGEWVMAIGCPFGLENTVTAGIVSAKGRVIGAGPYDDFIQTDASINPGNSGGPLLNMKGEVVGINTAIINGGHGIGFAVPVNMAKNILQQLKDKGEVVRGWLGVGIQDIDNEMAEYYNIKEGALIADVFAGDPAEKAGIKTGDIIIEVNGEKIKSSRDLTSMIATIPVGDQAMIVIMRDGRKKSFQVKISKREDETADSHTPTERTHMLGIRVSDVKGQVVITKVENDSAREGLMTGDIIKEVNHESIKTAKDYYELVKKIKKGQSVSLLLQRARSGFIVIKLIK